MANKVALITGASSGIGKALAFEYGNKGYSVVFTGRDAERVIRVAQELQNSGIAAKGLVLDSADEADNKKAVEETLTAYGSIDLLICNAGISMRALFEDIDPLAFQKVMDINFYGAVHATKAALPHILKSKGSIIAISSINGHRGTPARTAYTASKYAMQGFFEALRTEVMHRGVHILVACPGFTGTSIRQKALTANGSVQGESPRDESKMMSSEEVAIAIYKAHQRKKRDLVLTTQGKLAVWLNKIMPSQMDKIVYNVMAKEPDSPFK
jgi:dehydrogenase/reductase SDR family protein 7B